MNELTPFLDFFFKLLFWDMRVDILSDEYSVKSAQYLLKKLARSFLILNFPNYEVTLDPVASSSKQD